MASMASEVSELQDRLDAQLTQLLRECKLFERLWYANKNQHRRCLYFRVLSKVSRDLRLFQSASLKDILMQHFQVIEGNKPTQKTILLEGLKTRNSVVKGHEFQTKLLGVARLLAQMIEPIIEASSYFCCLIHQMFFVPFSIAMLALLARLRVLLQQTLHDVVHVFNMYSSVSQQRQSLRVLEGGPTVFRDYYPSNKPSLVLECHWDGVKFCLHEKFAQSERAIADVQATLLLDDDQGNDLHSLPTASTIKYNNFGASSEAMDGNEIGQENCLTEMASAEPSVVATMKNKKDTDENMPTNQIRKPDFVVKKKKKKNNDHGELLLPNEECSKDLLVGKYSSERVGLSDSTLLQSFKPAESKSAKKRKVASISVDVPLKTKAKLNNSAMDGNEIGQDNCLTEMVSAEPSVGATMKIQKDTDIQIRKPDFVVKKKKKKNNDHGELLLPNEECSKDLLVGKDSSERVGLSDSTLPRSFKPAESKSAKKRKVAFISVDVPLKTEAKLNNSAMDGNDIGQDNCLTEMASAEPSVGATMKNKKDTEENMPTIQIRKPDFVVKKKKKKNNDHSELLLPNEECQRIC